MPIRKAELLAFIADYDKQKGAIRKKLNNRSRGMQALAQRIDDLGMLPDDNVTPNNLIPLFRHILTLSRWDRNTLTGKIANDMRECILKELDIESYNYKHIFLENWTALSLGKGAPEDCFSIGFAKTLLARISNLRSKSEKEKFRKEFIAILEYNPKLREAILSEDKQYEDPMQQQAQRAIKNLLDGDPILATLMYKKFKRANKPLFEKHKAIWGRRSLTNAEQILATLKPREHNAFFDNLLMRPLDPTRELDIVAATEGKLWKAIHRYFSTGSCRNTDLHPYFQARLTMFDDQDLPIDIKTKLGLSQTIEEIPQIPAALATIILHVKSFWKQAKPSWWDKFLSRLERLASTSDKLRKNSPLFGIELDSPKDKLEPLWKTFHTKLKPQDRSIIAHHLCETLLAETTQDNFFSHMTKNTLQSQRLLAYALTIDRYRLILVQHEGVADLQDLSPTSKLKTAIDSMWGTQDPFIQEKREIIESLFGEQARLRSPGQSSAFVRHHLGDEGGTAALSDEEYDKPAADWGNWGNVGVWAGAGAGAGAAGAAFQEHHQSAAPPDERRWLLADDGAPRPRC
ncbi:MAG: hypothetical protein AABY34_00270 [Pseudomonadota bacterium]